MIFSFPYREERTRFGEIIFRPRATIELQGMDRAWYKFSLYADSGADVTLLRRSDCKILGYELTMGDERPLGGIGKGFVKTYVHRIKLKIGTMEFVCAVAFADEEEIPRLLGREDVFEYFRICFDQPKLSTDFITLNSEPRTDNP